MKKILSRATALLVLVFLTTVSAPAAEKPPIPWGISLPGRPGFVNSPYAAKHQLVDVTGLPTGMEVKCPYTGKLFRVPPAVAESLSKKEEAKTKTGLPYATKVPGWKDIVQSPFSSPGHLVDVTGFPSGAAAKCPYTKKNFLVP